MSRVTQYILIMVPYLVSAAFIWYAQYLRNGARKRRDINDAKGKRLDKIASVSMAIGMVLALVSIYVSVTYLLGLWPF